MDVFKKKLMIIRCTPYQTTTLPKGCSQKKIHSNHPRQSSMPAPQSNHSDDLSLLFCLYPSSSMPLWYIQQTITVMHSGGWCGLPGSGQHGGFFL